MHVIRQRPSVVCFSAAHYTFTCLYCTLYTYTAYAFIFIVTYVYVVSYSFNIWLLREHRTYGIQMQLEIIMYEIVERKHDLNSSYTSGHVIITIHFTANNDLMNYWTK